MPILRSFLPTLRPGVSLGRMKALMPRDGLAARSVTAKRMNTSPLPPLVIQVLVPVMT